MKAKILKQKDGYTFEVQDSRTHLYIFKNSYGFMEGYECVKFILTCGEVLFGNPDSSSCTLQRNRNKRQLSMEK